MTEFQLSSPHHVGVFEQVCVEEILNSESRIELDEYKCVAVTQSRSELKTDRWLVGACLLISVLDHFVSNSCT